MYLRRAAIDWQSYFHAQFIDLTGSYDPQLTVPGRVLGSKYLYHLRQMLLQGLSSNYIDVIYSLVVSKHSLDEIQLRYT